MLSKCLLNKGRNAGGGNPAFGIETEEMGSGDWHAISGGVGSRVCKELWSSGGPDSPVANMLKGQILGVSVF